MTALVYTEGGMKNLTVCNNVFSFSPAASNTFEALLELSGSNTSVGPTGVYNNTFENSGTNSMSAGFLIRGSFSNVTVKNNIFDGMQYAIDVEDTGSRTGFTSDRNLLNGTSTDLIWGGTFQTYTAWVAAGRDTNSRLSVLPRFVSAPTNLHLTATSPAIGNAADLRGLSIAILNADYDGVTRGASWDIGAYKYAASGTPHAVRSPASMEYGSHVLFSSSAGDQVVTLTNDGDAGLTIASIDLSGTNAGDFSQTHDCPDAPATLAAGSSCTVTATFTPTVAGARSASLSIADDGLGSPQTIALTGTGLAAAIKVRHSQVVSGN
jgi:hypothetical protein